MTLVQTITEPAFRGGIKRFSEPLIIYSHKEEDISEIREPEITPESKHSPESEENSDFGKELQKDQPATIKARSNLSVIAEWMAHLMLALAIAAYDLAEILIAYASRTLIGVIFAGGHWLATRFTPQSIAYMISEYIVQLSFGMVEVWCDTVEFLVPFTVVGAKWVEAFYTPSPPTLPTPIETSNPQMSTQSAPTPSDEEEPSSQLPIHVEGFEDQPLIPRGRVAEVANMFGGQGRRSWKKK